MERLRVVDEDFIAEPQVLPSGFDNIESNERSRLLVEFNYQATTPAGLNITEISVAWDMYAGVPKEETAERLEVFPSTIESIRMDVRSWEARRSLQVLSRVES